MQRRDLLKMIAAATGMTFVGGDVWAAGLDKTAANSQISAPSNNTLFSTALFSPAAITLLDEIAETILPRTETPGAKDALCGQQMAVMVQDCYDNNQQQLFLDGLKSLQQSSLQAYQREFLQLTVAQRSSLLSQLDKDARAHNSRQLQGEHASAAPHYFTLLKQLTIFVFFTSKVAATEVLRYVAVPGHYDGAFPYKKGDRAWAT